MSHLTDPSGAASIVQPLASPPLHDLIAQVEHYLEATEDPDGISIAANAFGVMVLAYILPSVSASAFEDILTGILLFRNTMDEMEEPDMWNVWVRSLKWKVRSDELGGIGRALWEAMKENGLGLLVGGWNGASEEERFCFWDLEPGEDSSRSEYHTSDSSGESSSGHTSEMGDVNRELEALIIDEPGTAEHRGA
ncbi:MAG: ATP-dependent DNA helicase II subunit 2 [Lasallia pustulata]|uniref:ATP-dependent DNA helicase II subunit 2 n=1 Tax=Lasallia pustulata TaxID=136370 RepID=A0A5M8PBM5_9LECA|nr:MAG: ATP-dependent DNA helicase II subunit 2 [Lasallia pustulata]